MGEFVLIVSPSPAHKLDICFRDCALDPLFAGASMCSESLNVTSSINTASQDPAYNIGAIVGGTAGGFAALMIALFAIWRKVYRINHAQVN